MTVLIISAACCYPGLAAFDEQAKLVIEQALRETGVEGEAIIIPGATAVYGGVVPKKVMNTLMNKFSRNETGPAIIFNGDIIAYGVPKLDEMKTILKNLTQK